MKDLHKYCYSIVAACFIALGTGFLSISQYTLSFEKEAKKLAYELEEKEKIKIDRNADCGKLKTEAATCKYVIHLFSTNAGYLDLSEKIANFILYTLFSFLIIGGFLHYKQIKSLP